MVNSAAIGPGVVYVLDYFYRPNDRLNVAEHVRRMDPLSDERAGHAGGKSAVCSASASKANVNPVPGWLSRLAQFFFGPESAERVSVKAKHSASLMDVPDRFAGRAAYEDDGWPQRPVARFTGTTARAFRLQRIALLSFHANSPPLLKPRTM